jgi:spore coat polysaccharide biosynthesis protein SpsF (cytidylyltransferase family)
MTHRPSFNAWSNKMAINPRQTIALIDLAVESDARTPRWEMAQRRLDGLTLIEWSVRRLSEVMLVDSIVITGPAKLRSMLSQTGLCNAHWIPSAFPTPSQRAADIADRFGADWVVLVNPTCPFLDPALIDRLISRGLSEPDADFVGFVAPNRPSFSLQSLGLVAEMCSSRGLAKIFHEDLSSDTLDIPQLVRLHSNQFRSIWIPLPAELSTDRMRFAMETEEDWDRANTFMEALGEDVSWQRLAQVANRDSH